MFHCCVQAQFLARKGGAGVAAAATAAEQPKSTESAAPERAQAKTAQHMLSVPATPALPNLAAADAAKAALNACAAFGTPPRPGCKDASGAADRGPGASSRESGKENIDEAASSAAAPITPIKRPLDQHLPGDTRCCSLCMARFWAAAWRTYLSGVPGGRLTFVCGLQRPRAASGAGLHCKQDRQP